MNKLPFVAVLALTLCCPQDLLVHGIPVSHPTPTPPANNETIVTPKDGSFRFWDGIMPKGDNETNWQNCKLIPVDSAIHRIIGEIIEKQAKLIEYNLIIRNYTSNPLLWNQTYSYKSNKWSRVGSSHGQTILNLAFNYDVLSLMALSFGIEKLDIELVDQPRGCLGNLQEMERLWVVLDIAMRDFKVGGDVSVFQGESSVCHRVIEKVSDLAKFTDRCCFEARESTDVVCTINPPNKWLEILDILLATLTIAVFVFGAFFMPDWVYTAAMDNIDYYVKLKEPLYKRLVVSRQEYVPTDIKATHVIDLRNKREFSLCRRLIAELPSDVIVPIKISQMDIKVNYRKLLQENKVPVGIFTSLSRAIFLCKIKELEPVKDCCNAKLFGHCPCNPMVHWIHICTLFGRLLLVIFLPLPYYIRLIVYYFFEDPEITNRFNAADNLGMSVYYNYRLLQYLTPTHPIYLSAYVFYLTTGVCLAYFSARGKKTKYQAAIMESFSDLKNLSMLNAMGMVISNCLWPFKKFGIFGVFIGIIIWPFLMPLSIVACVIYCLPIVFISCRITYNIFRSSSSSTDRSDQKKGMVDFTTDTIIRKIGSKSNLKKAKEGICYSTIKKRRAFLNVSITLVCLMTLYSAMLMLAEVCGFVAEIMCFTLMGLIVNASKVLKYGSLLFLVVIYSYECYENVTKKYLKLNKALFGEVKKRLGNDIDEFTQLPSSLQENRGFKACEASEQAEYENIDDISHDHPDHWDINDMILFVDKEDTPRIPKKLFDDVCAIQVAGSPGPVYKSLIQATTKFMLIILFLVFVFIVVLSFGESYKISSTNQMLATMAGGFMPFIFRRALKPTAPEVETNLVSFRSKLEEVIKNFEQSWPMHDFIFDVEEEPEEDENGSKDENESIKSHREEKKINNKDQNDYMNGKHARDDLALLAPPSRKASMFGGLDLNMDGIPDGLLGRTLTPQMGRKFGSMTTPNIPLIKTDDLKPKQNKKDKNNHGKMTFNFMKQTEIQPKAVRNKIDTLELEPSEGEHVDILVILRESDQEWVMEWSSITNMDVDELRM